MVYTETDPSYLRGPDCGPAQAEELTGKVGHTYGQFWWVFLNHISPHPLPNPPQAHPMAPYFKEKLLILGTALDCSGLLGRSTRPVLSRNRGRRSGSPEQACWVQEEPTSGNQQRKAGHLCDFCRTVCNSRFYRVSGGNHIFFASISLLHIIYKRVALQKVHMAKKKVSTINIKYGKAYNIKSFESKMSLGQ